MYHVMSNGDSWRIVDSNNKVIIPKIGDGLAAYFLRGMLNRGEIRP